MDWVRWDEGDFSILWGGWSGSGLGIYGVHRVRTVWGAHGVCGVRGVRGAWGVWVCGLDEKGQIGCVSSYVSIQPTQARLDWQSK